MAEARIYDLQREQLGHLLEQASGPAGSTLLIPNLQRPFVWTPDQVRLLVDSLLRGWPFGTLLLWRIDATTSTASIPSRPFWSLVDRTEEVRAAQVSERHPPAKYRMVLDGQQRLQSLILAVGGDDFGFRLYDADWDLAVDGGKRKTRGSARWSRGELFLDLPAYAEQLARTQNPREVDYREALIWACADPNDGRSVAPQRKTYQYPIPLVSECPGRLIRLRRLWQLADSARSRLQLKVPVKQLLQDYQVADDLLGTRTEEVLELVDLLGRVKATDVSYLELQAYRTEHGSVETYNDAVVSIFTRLNTAGRTLTEQEISFAWIKTYWDGSKTEGRQADDCFDDLREELTQFGLRLNEDDMVKVVSALWSVLCADGKLLSRRDLLRPEKVRPLASDLDDRWRWLSEALVWTAKRVYEHGLVFRTHFESLNAFTSLAVSRVLAVNWLETHPLGLVAHDAFEKKFAEPFDKLVVRWFAVTQWARAWLTAESKTYQPLLEGLAKLKAELDTTLEPNDAVSLVAEWLPKWLETHVAAATDFLDKLRVADRKYVSQYYLPLWIWHRLDPKRFTNSSVTLQTPARVKATPDVDHLVSVSVWEKRLQARRGDLAGSDLVDLVNEIGNCWLMEKNFNCSKSDRPLLDLLSQVHEFKSGARDVTEWSVPLLIPNSLLVVNGQGLDSLAEAIRTRTDRIKQELKDFVAGQAVPCSG